MFSKLSVIVASVLVTLAAATPTARNTPPKTTPQDSPQCCASVVSSSSTAASAVAGLLGIDLSGLDVPIGLSCSPITVGNNWYVHLIRSESSILCRSCSGWDPIPASKINKNIFHRSGIWYHSGGECAPFLFYMHILKILLKINKSMRGCC
ncbi:hypothetical protein C8J57DRAFT_285411 [Mycena rebaudengoi]|nr:hypothetical protein C8J57DRAFT_285411 [Mycena rebaudengoi]